MTGHRDHVHGVRTARTGRAGHRAFGVLVLLLAAVVGQLGPGLPNAAAAGGVVITLNSITPSFPSPTGPPLAISGEVRNTSTHAAPTPQIQLWLDHTRLTSRGALATTLRPGEHDGAPVPGAVARPAGALAPGASMSWQLTVPVKALGLRANGVYPLSVVAVGAGGDRVGIVKTALPWMQASKDYQPTRLVMLWPLADQPRMTGAGKVDNAGALTDPVLTDDALASSFASSAAGGDAGRLNRLLVAGLAAQQDHTPLTWAIDPDLLATARAMSGQYQVGAAKKPGGGSDAARSWLATLKLAAGQASTVLTLPYADQDVAAIAHAAARTPHVDRRADLATARTLSDRVAATILGRQVTTDVAWPGSETADSSVLTALRSAGYGKVILGDTTVPATDEPSFTPGGAARIGGLTAYVADTTLDGVVGADSAAPGAATLLAQRFLAETAMITEEAPSDARTILLAPPRDWNPDPRFVTALLNALGHAPWLTPVSLGADEVAAGHGHQLRAQPDPGRLTPSYLGSLAGLHSQLGELVSVLPSAPQRLTGPYEPAILRTESMAWRRKAPAAARFRDTVKADLQTLHNRVGVNTASTLTLSGNSGSLPFTVVNDLEQPVSVKLRVVSLNTTRLDVDDTQPLVVPGGGRTQVKIRVRDVVGPRVRLRAQLLTRAGQPYGPSQQVTVVSTNFGVIGLSIIFGAVALILVVVAVRLRRRARGPAGPAADATSAPPPPGDGCVSGEPEGATEPRSDEKLTR